MSYDSDHDFNWFFRALPPRGQIPGGPTQELPHIVSSTVMPTVDGLGWLRYGQLVFEAAFVTNGTIAALVTVPSGEAHLYVHGSLRVTGGDPPATATFWQDISDPAGFVSVTENSGAGILNGQFVSEIKRPILVPAGFALRGRSDQQTGVGFSLNIETYKIILGLGEYVPPR